jgi:hypothetical protein
MTMRNNVLFASVTISLILASCSSFHAREAWKAKGETLRGGLSVEIGPGAPRSSEPGSSADFRIRGDALEGAVLRGQARREGGLWKLKIDRMDWFNNWNEGWTEASFEAEGELSLVPGGDSWAIVVDRAPAIGKPGSASIRLYGDYFVGDKALGLFSRRWDRIKTEAELLKQRFPDEWRDTDKFRRGVRAFLFPELYGYAKAGAPPPGPDHGVSVGESIHWDTDYSASAFPETLREIRNSGTMLRDFEESLGLWRLWFRWDGFWNEEIIAARFAANGKE